MNIQFRLISISINSRIFSKYEYYFLLLKIIFYSLAALVRNIHIFEPPCNILSKYYMYVQYIYVNTDPVDNYMQSSQISWHGNSVLVHINETFSKTIKNLILLLIICTV